MTEGGDDRQIHIRLSDDTHRQLRIRCAELDVTIRDCVAGVMEDSLEVIATNSKARRETRSRP